jgi:glycosyltransferase involved in cell wall biosynthesis
MHSAMPPPRISLVLPAYREAKTIARTLAGARAHLERAGGDYEIVAVCGGDDGTAAAARAAAAGDPRVIVLDEPRRAGKGRAVRAGVAVARGVIVGFADADGKVPFPEMDGLVEWLHRGFDVAIGSRARPDSRIERRPRPVRRAGSRLFSALRRALVPLPGIADTQCGFKFFRGESARALFARQRVDGYMFDVEVLALALAAGLRVKEVGVRWADDGDSRLDLVASARNVLDLLRIASQSTKTSRSGADRNA